MRAAGPLGGAQPLYTNQLLLGGVLANVTDNMFEERAKSAIALRFLGGAGAQK